MVAYLRSRSHRFPVALIAGVGIAAVVAALVLALPEATYAQVIDGLTLPGLLPAGTAGRALVAFAAGSILGAIGWAIVVLTVGTHVLLHTAGADTPVLRPADSHPDAPARRPISASAELGPPLELDPPSHEDQPLPADLDQPLAAFDPAAIPAAPREPVRPVAALAPVERLETFELTPLVRDRQAAPATLGSLLDRLERSAAQGPRRPARSLEAALGALRDSPA